MIPQSHLAEEGPRSTADNDLRRAHMPMRSSGSAPDEHHDPEPGGVSEPKRVGVVHEHDVLRRGIASCLDDDLALDVETARDEIGRAHV